MHQLRKSSTKKTDELRLLGEGRFLLSITTKEHRQHGTDTTRCSRAYSQNSTWDTQRGVQTTHRWKYYHWLVSYGCWNSLDMVCCLSYTKSSPPTKPTVSLWW